MDTDKMTSQDKLAAMIIELKVMVADVLIENADLRALACKRGARLQVFYENISIKDTAYETIIESWFNEDGTAK